MFITRATRHDRDEVRELVKAQGWSAEYLAEGTTMIARDGPVAGCVRLIEVAPQTVVIDDFIVREDKRGQGIGAQLMKAAMNNRGGTLYLVCHEDVLGFYDKFEFKQTSFDDLPDPVKEYLTRVEDHLHDADHEHFYLTAR